MAGETLTVLAANPDTKRVTLSGVYALEAYPTAVDVAKKARADATKALGYDQWSLKVDIAHENGTEYWLVTVEARAAL